MVEFQLNGATCSVTSPPMTSLVEVLRTELFQTGTKAACMEGFCGSCVVMVDDTPMVSCLLPIGRLDGCSVRTIEGESPGATELSPVQRSLVDADAVQCGMCFPGIVMEATALLERTTQPTDQEIQAALVGHICRCTGYEAIVQAIAASGGCRQG